MILVNYLISAMFFPFCIHEQKNPIICFLSAINRQKNLTSVILDIDSYHILIGRKFKNLYSN